MTNSIRNIFGVATAIIVLLGFNVITNNFISDSRTSDKILTESNTDIKSAEERAIYSLKDLNDELVDIAEKTNPAVVTITTEKTAQVQMMNPFAQFFGNPNARQEREFVQRGLGSGVIVSQEGYIITNNHVIDGVDKIKVALFNGDEVNAELVGTDPETDIAVLKIDGDNLPTVQFGDSDNLKVGSFVLAIGSPLDANLAHTVSFGIVSAKGRALNNLTIFGNYIQTDAAINPGNSGGALIDMNGELVGINSAIASRSGGNDGIGFAIPINIAERIMNDLIEDGSVSRGYLGMIFGGEVDRTMAKGLGLDEPGGIIVGNVEKGGPSDDAGLQEKDVIISMNGEKVTNWDGFRNRIATMKPGDKVKLDIIRDSEKKKIEIKLGERESLSAVNQNNNSNESLSDKLGFGVANLSATAKQQLGLSESAEGVLVQNIRQTSNAFERGLRQNDVVLKVRDQKVASVREFNNAITKAMDDNTQVVLLTIMRNGLQQYIAFEL